MKNDSLLSALKDFGKGKRKSILDDEPEEVAVVVEDEPSDDEFAALLSGRSAEFEPQDEETDDEFLSLKDGLTNGETPDVDAKLDLLAQKYPRIYREIFG